MSEIKARFVQGSILRHIIIMTLTSALGLTFTFLIDFLALFWIAQLEDSAMNAAIAISGAIVFVTVSVAIAFMIPAVALVSRSLGRGDIAKAREFATAAMIFIVVTLSIIALILLLSLDAILPRIAKGASDESLAYARHFLVMVLPSIVLFGIGVTASAILRAQGDAKRAMYVTVVGGLIAMIIDPILIVWMELGVTGAAISFIVTRAAMALLGLYYIGVKYDFLIKPSQIDFKAFAPPFFAIAIPALLTQISTPVGNIILTRAIAPFGDDALTGMAVSFRVMLLGFGGIFALSGAIGGIIGQNYGAGHLERVRETYMKAIGFGAAWALITWGILLLARPFIIEVFALKSIGLEVVNAFIYSAGYFIFVSALFVSNAAFNNLGRPIWSTGTNWFRDVLLTMPMLALLVPIWGATGVIYTQAIVGILAGSLAAMLGWRYINDVASGRAQIEKVRA